MQQFIDLVLSLLLLLPLFTTCTYTIRLYCIDSVYDAVTSTSLLQLDLENSQMNRLPRAIVCCLQTCTLYACFHYIYMYSTRQNNLPMNGLFNGHSILRKQEYERDVNGIRMGCEQMNPF